MKTDSSRLAEIWRERSSRDDSEQVCVKNKDSRKLERRSAVFNCEGGLSTSLLESLKVEWHGGLDVIVEMRRDVGS